MKRLVGWSAATMSLAALFHLAGVWYLPRFITRAAVNRVSRAANLGPYNRMSYGRIHSAGEDVIVLDNPDSMFSFAAYDVSERPVLIKCVVPDTNNYWSVSFYAWNTDNFFVVNDMTAKAKRFDLVLVRPGSKYQRVGDEVVVTAPSEKGVVLVRMMVNDRNDKEELARLTGLQRQTVIQELGDVAY